MTAGGVLDHILKDLQVISGAQQGRITKIDFALAGSCDFVMMTLDVDADFSQRQRNFRTNVDQGVDRSDGDVSFFGANAMTKIRPCLRGAASGVPVPFVGINRITGFTLFVVIVDAVKNKELCLRTKVRDLCNAGALQITLSAH